MKLRRATLPLLLASAAALALGLAGCAPEPADSAASARQDSPKTEKGQESQADQDQPKETAEPDSEAETEPADETDESDEQGSESSDAGTEAKAAALPATCKKLISDSAIQKIQPNMYLLGEGSDTKSALSKAMGPLTVRTLFDGSEQLYCSWGIPNSDGGASVGIARIAEKQRKTLVKALNGSVYSAADAAHPVADKAFENHQLSNDHQYLEEILFVDDVMIVSVHSANGNFADAAATTITSGA